MRSKPCKLYNLPCCLSAKFLEYLNKWLYNYCFDAVFFMKIVKVPAIRLQESLSNRLPTTRDSIIKKIRFYRVFCGFSNFASNTINYVRRFF